jgi:catechol 2,3-dioxygenase-like lactoylglutathione lyase family enzyme
MAICKCGSKGVLKVFDHLGIPVADYAAAKKFYEKALAPLGVKLLVEIPREHTGDLGVCGFGVTQPQFWISEGRNQNKQVHIAFAAADHKTVDEFYEASMAAGATDNGKPGPRPHYHEHYYGGFILDLDGNNIEAVCHMPA